MRPGDEICDSGELTGREVGRYRADLARLLRQSRGLSFRGIGQILRVETETARQLVARGSRAASRAGKARRG